MTDKEIVGQYCTVYTTCGCRTFLRAGKGEPEGSSPCEAQVPADRKFA
jgi:hypothetical protein